MFKNKEEFKFEFSRRIIESYGRTVEEAHITEKFMVLETMVRDYASVNWAASKAVVQNNEQKQMHYFSMEFLMGRLLVNNMMNLGIYEIAKEGLEDYGINIHDLEELESDAGLGNGGLGRLAACFMDSLASLDYPGHGNTIRYEYGLFKQKIENGYQVELPDQWMKTGFMWEVRKPKHRVPVKFFGKVIWDENEGKWKHVDAETIYAVPYDVPVIGNDTVNTNTLRLWSAEPSEDFPSNHDFQRYIEDVRSICQNLYPDDSTPAGKMLRLKQEYFFCSAGIQAIIKAHLRNYPSLDNFHEKHVIQLNDTHPVLCIPEFMRLLIDEHNYEWQDAWDICTQTFAYTNHTILAEALETWPINTMQTLLPRVYQIIEEIHRRFVGFAKEVSNHDQNLVDRTMILRDGTVYMARLAIAGSFSVNGVARLHTDILKERELHDFNVLYPNKFNNKTNGVTHRRWLAYCNPQLSELINETIGKGWIKKPAQLENLMEHVDDPILQNRFLAVKKERKQILADYIKEHNGIEVDVDSIFDVQVKRLHAYKRQLLNVLHILYLYHEILDNPEFEIIPRTFIFGAKAAPGYYLAKCIIKLINSVADLINNDPRVKDKVKVVFIENYGVSIAEKIIPAANVSEQISTTTKEASGTGNMKLMMNGAITMATMDGANVEISEQVGKENMFIFGLNAEQVLEYNKCGGYSSKDLYHSDRKIKRVVDDLVNGFIPGLGKDGIAIYDSLITYNDEYFVLRDFYSYIEAQKSLQELYRNQDLWNKISLKNTACSGFFSSDRTIEEYINDIWFKEGER